MTAEEVGTSGNLQVNDTLNIVSAIAGASQAATVATIVTTGADPETDAAYRSRVLFAMRAVTGGSNATDHKIWGEEVEGVRQVFPYAGKPVGGGTSYPGDRTLYVECDPDIDSDGIAPSGLLADVRAAVTASDRPALGLTDSTLYVEPITRTAIDVEITNLAAPSGQDATVKSAISAALDAYFAALVPYVGGVDLLQERNDKITALTLSQVVQEVLNATGSAAEGVVFEVATTPYDLYLLGPGERTKTGTVAYVVI
jgi:hypothetical protein